MIEVIKGFRDESTNIDYIIGDEYSGNRIDELSELGYVKVPKKRAVKKEE